VVKCLAGPVWDNRLAVFVSLFSKRRDEFLFAMSVRTTMGMVELNQTAKNMAATSQAVDERCAFQSSFWQPY
jgi:hypothetical protein